MEIAKNIFDKFTTKPVKVEHRECYELFITWDSNDGDYIKDFFYIDKETFKNYPLFQYILSYLCGGSKFGTDSTYGKHVSDDPHFYWLEDFLVNEGLMLYSDWGPCHSVYSIDMKYYNENGVREQVIIPRFDTLFEGKSEKEMEDFINKLYYGEG